MSLQYSLFNQDVFEGLSQLKCDSFDLCIVDPPYGASTKNNWEYGNVKKISDFGGSWNL